MKPKIQTMILFFLTAVFAVSAFMLVRQMASYRAGDEAYAEASEIAAIPEVLETETVCRPVCAGAGADGPACSAAGQQ